MLKDISIRYKLILMVLAIFILISSITFIIFSISESKNQKRNLEREAVFIAQFTADYCTAPLVFKIKEETTEVLENLKTNPAVLYTAIYETNGELFDNYNPLLLEIPNNLSINKNFDSITSTKIYDANKKISYECILVQLPVKYENERYGTVVIAYSLEQANILFKRNIRAAASIALIILLIVLFLAYVFQKLFTEPILALASVTEKVKRDGNYKIRLSKRNNDEIGVLYDRFNNMLEQIELRDRARDETEKRLEEAKTEAENADKLKSAFLANMSHEIRTPMNSIVGFAGLLSDEDIEDEERHEYIELIDSSCNTLLHLIDDILDISKIEAGQLSISIESCSLPILLHELYLNFNELNWKVNQKNVELVFNQPASLPNLIVMTDPIRLKQILSNLLSNAIKFTKQGKIELGYTLVDKVKNNKSEKFVEIFVNDTGIGMTPDTSKFIFERFTKIETNSEKLYRGAGLGLTISKKLVEMLDGEIWVESTPDKGSTFFITIPAAINKDDPEFKSLNTSTAKEFTLYKSFKNKKILIVEDDKSNYELLHAILKKTNAIIYWAVDGIEALEYCKQNVPDIILMDIKMPNMDGYETLAKLRKINISVPVIAQTAFAHNNDAAKILKSGFNAYLSKPIDKENLLRTIENFISE